METAMALFLFVASIVAGIFLGGHVTLAGTIVVSVAFVLLIRFFQPSLLDDAGITQTGLALGLIAFWLSAFAHNKEYFQPKIEYVLNLLFK